MGTTNSTMVWITLPTERSSIHFLATQVLIFDLHDAYRDLIYRTL